MKKLILCLIAGLLIFTATNVSAYSPDNFAEEFNPETATKEDAIVYIEKSLSDPEINKWVADKFGSEKLFLISLKLAPEKTVKEIATTFSNLQKVGGDYGAAEWAATIVILIEFAVLMVGVIMLIGMVL